MRIMRIVMNNTPKNAPLLERVFENIGTYLFYGGY
jgi:hypothetical protein